MSKFQKEVYKAVKKIPFGRIASYAEIAFVIKKPRAMRAVGNALSKNRNSDIPCHRVVRSDGAVGGYAYGTRAKIKLLKREGVSIKYGKADSRHIID